MNRHSLELIAHRGYAARFPENSLEAVHAAIIAGANYIEVDVQMSADGVPVLFHDRNLKRLCGDSAAVHQKTSAQLTAMIINPPGITNTSVAHSHICLLETLVYHLMAHTNVHLFVELKRVAIEHHGAKKLVNEVLRIISPIKSQCTLISYSSEALAMARTQGCRSLGYIADDWRSFVSTQLPLQDLNYLFCDIESLPETGGLAIGNSQLAVYECKDIIKALSVSERGVDMVETFHIGEMLVQLKRKKHELL